MHEDDRWILYVDRKEGAEGGTLPGRGPAQLRATLIMLYDEGHRSGSIEQDPPYGIVHRIYFTKTAHRLNRLIRWAKRETVPPAQRRRRT
jgi:hypothetical protein